jgi:hypothetical protein
MGEWSCAETHPTILARSLFFRCVSHVQITAQSFQARTRASVESTVQLTLALHTRHLTFFQKSCKAPIPKLDVQSVMVLFTLRKNQDIISTAVPLAQMGKSLELFNDWNSAVGARLADDLKNSNPPLHQWTVDLTLLDTRTSSMCLLMVAHSACKLTSS